MKRIKAGFGYWDTTIYPLGGCFKRAGVDGVEIVKVLRDLRQFSLSARRGCDEEGLTADGRKVCYSTANCE